MSDSIFIRNATIDEVVELSKQIPEFDNPHETDVYKERLMGKDQLILLALVDDKPAGFKVGYDKFKDGSFYTWMGGVLPKFRRLGLANKLAQAQEAYARKKGYNKILLKTRNIHRGMRLFATKSGFDIVEVIPRKKIEENRIVLQKTL